MKIIILFCMTIVIVSCRPIQRFDIKEEGFKCDVSVCKDAECVEKMKKFCFETIKFCKENPGMYK